MDSVVGGEGARGATASRGALFRAPPARPLVAASILSADFSRLGDECRAVIAAGADAIHVDVMDGHFVPNLSMGPAVCAAVRRAVPGAMIDVHLMVEQPSRFLEPFAKAGADHCTVHREVEEDLPALLAQGHSLGMSMGVAINPDTPATALASIAEPCELMLVMSVHPGYSGQAFIPAVLDKVRSLRARFGASRRIEIDGGVSPANAHSCVEAGVDVVVSASALFGSRDYGATIAALRG
ncbi:MAG: ribulose-phosphate 3-epimerase [Phycisphaerae bacterium]|nr:ribulose-phosphate 3-epimerase [Phycisphaerae bacterium]